MVWIIHCMNILALNHLVLLPVVYTISKPTEECLKFVADGGIRSGKRVYLFTLNVKKLNITYLVLTTFLKIYFLCHLNDNEYLFS